MRNLGDILTSIRNRARGLVRCERGNVAIIFALAFIPFVGAVGSAVDYSRKNSARVALQDAVDAAGLILSKSAASLTTAQLESKADALIRVNFHRPEVHDLVISTVFAETSPGNYKLNLVATGTMSTTIAAIFTPTMTVSSSAEVVWGMKRLELALALDNTGSMSSSSKMTQLKLAAKDLVKTLQNAAKKPEDVKISIIPFATDVNVGTGNVNANWVRWDEWEAQPAALVSSKPTNWLDLEAGDTCPFTNSGSYKFKCLQAPNSSSTSSKIPSSGLICPSPNSDGTVYNGCYDTNNPTTEQVASGRNASCGSTQNCSCSGSGNNKVCTKKTGFPWVPNNRNTWGGCVFDRDQDHDVKNTATNTNLKTTLYPAHQDDNCPVSMMTLTNNWASLNAKIDSMQPVGNTNVTIGLQMAFQTLSPVAPFNAATPTDDLDKVIILLTDGENTENRWSKTAKTIDKRTELACDNVKGANIKIYTIRVINGNATLLRACATKPDMYYDVQNASQLTSVFNTIAQSLANLRLAK